MLSVTGQRLSVTASRFATSTAIAAVIGPVGKIPPIGGNSLGFEEFKSR
jgi:hypothetical protein